MFDLNYTDCKACFACKVRGNKTNGVCAIRDELRPVLEKIHEANAVVIGSPVYFNNLTGETHSLINRMLFPPVHYEDDGSLDKLLPIKKKCGLIVTMNVPEKLIGMGYTAVFENISYKIGEFFGFCETLYSCDTYQFNDYSKYYAGTFSEPHKAAHREKQFPIDLQNAYELGKRLVL